MSKRVEKLASRKVWKNDSLLLVSPYRVDTAQRSNSRWVCNLIAVEFMMRAVYFCARNTRKGQLWFLQKNCPSFLGLVLHQVEDSETAKGGSIEHYDYRRCLQWVIINATNQYGKCRRSSFSFSWSSVISLPLARCEKLNPFSTGLLRM